MFSFLTCYILLLLLLVVLFTPHITNAEENSDKENTNNNTTTTNTDNIDINDETPEKNWGTYYDPKDVFCGQYDCYKILGFDWESFGRSPPDSRDITRKYRTLSRRWHPDKNRDRGAKERFVKINKAYSVLTDSTKRTEYDYLRERPDEYFHKYGSTVMFHYAPKSDARFIAIIFLCIGSIFTYVVQKQRWQTVADHVVKAALDNLGSREGGSTESIELRRKGEEILLEKRRRKKLEEEGGGVMKSNGAVNGNNSTKRVTSTSITTTKSSSKKEKKLTKKELKMREQDELRPILQNLVRDIHDFGGGYHQPTYRDILIIKLLFLPIHAFRIISWQIQFWIRRLCKKELSVEEKEVLTERMVGSVAWDAASLDEREDMMKNEVWKSSKRLEDWKELKEVEKLGPGHQKRYGRWKKKQGASKLE